MSISTVFNTILTYILWMIRPLLGPSNCRYTIGCTQYAYQQLNNLPTHKALWAIIKRVSSCSPCSSYHYK